MAGQRLRHPRRRRAWRPTSCTRTQACPGGHRQRHRGRRAEAARADGHARRSSAPMKPLRDTPTRTGYPSAATRSSAAQEREVVLDRLPEADAGIDDDRVGRDRRPRRAASRARGEERRAPPRPRRGSAGRRCIVAGVPRMCISTTGTSASAHSGQHRRIEAPAPNVVHQVGAGVERGSGDRRLAWCRPRAGPGTAARTARSTGSSRRSSSRDGHRAGAGRVDSAPRSSSAGALAPPSRRRGLGGARRVEVAARRRENESGVAFRTPTTTDAVERERAGARAQRPDAAGGTALRPWRRPRRGGHRCGSRTWRRISSISAPSRDSRSSSASAILCSTSRLRRRSSFARSYASRMMRRTSRVDLHRGGLGVVDPLGEVAAEEDLLFLLAEGHRAELLAHAPLADHLAGQLGRPLDVVRRRRCVMWPSTSSSAARPPKRMREAVRAGSPRCTVCRSSIGTCCVSPSAMPRGMIVTLCTGSAPGSELRDQRVAGLVVGRVAPLLEADDHASAARSPSCTLSLASSKSFMLDLVLVLRGRRAARPR